MTTSPSSTPASDDVAKEGAVSQVFGADPWMRFDLWSNRSWEAAQGAVSVAASNGPPMGSDDGLDTRVISLFHAAEVAKEFADMVNPLNAVVGAKYASGPDMKDHVESVINKIIDTEEQGQ